MTVPTRQFPGRRPMTDTEVVDAIADGMRTAEWSVSFLEDIAALVAKVRDIDRENDSARGETDWYSH